METNARPTRALFMALPIGAACWQLFDAFMLWRGASWGYYLGEPATGFWCLVLGISVAAVLRPWPLRYLRAGIFVWLAVIYGVLPTQAGSMAAHPDFFLEEAVDRVRERIERRRAAGSLPVHTVDLHKALQLPDALHYRRGETSSLPIQVVIHPEAHGPNTQAAPRPGVIHVASERRSGRIWLTATGLGFSRFSDPLLLREGRGDALLVVEIPGHRPIGRKPEAPLPSP